MPIVGLAVLTILRPKPEGIRLLQAAPDHPFV
jgi:hypothetical protein